jgi:hypothetical protein
MINEVLQDLTDHGVMVYIDDILIYTHDMKQHEILVKEMLSRLHGWNFAVSINKYKFHIDTVKFLGYIIS